MTPSGQPSNLRKIIVGVVVFIGVFFLVHALNVRLHTSEGQRRARVEAARQHAEFVAPLLQKDKRFAFVRVSEWWKDDGYFLVSGAVEKSDVMELRKLIFSTHPPAPIAWQFSVVDGATNSQNDPANK